MELSNITLTKIAEGVADEAKCFELLNRPWPKAAGEWFEIQEAQYWYFLEILPPLDFTGCNFALCEFDSGTKTDGFFKIAGRFYCCMVDYRGPGTVDAYARALRAELVPA